MTPTVMKRVEWVFYSNVKKLSTNIPLRNLLSFFIPFIQMLNKKGMFC